MQTGVEKLAALRVFLLSNNKIASWGEVERLGSLTALEELLLVGNPLYNEFKDKGDTQNYRIEVCNEQTTFITGVLFSYCSKPPSSQAGVCLQGQATSQLKQSKSFPMPMQAKCIIATQTALSLADDDTAGVGAQKATTAEEAGWNSS